jgi:CHASE1-domain containing sensor protein
VSNALFLNPSGDLIGAVRQILTGLASMNLETQAVTQINIVQERITDMISVLLSTQEELIKLLTENRELRHQVKNNTRDVIEPLVG